jgi:hypothetical protein
MGDRVRELVWVSLETVDGGSRVMHVADADWTPPGVLTVPIGRAGTMADTLELLSIVSSSVGTREFVVTGPPLATAAGIVVRYVEKPKPLVADKAKLGEMAAAIGVTPDDLRAIRRAGLETETVVLVSLCGCRRLIERGPTKTPPPHGMVMPVPLRPGIVSEFLAPPTRHYVFVKTVKLPGYQDAHVYIEHQTTPGTAFPTSKTPRPDLRDLDDLVEAPKHWSDW